MTVQQGPTRCQEYMPYDGDSFQVCYMGLPCTKQHASTREIARKFDEWATLRAYANVWLSLEEGHDPKDIQLWVGAILGLNMSREENDAFVRALVENS